MKARAGPSVPLSKERIERSDCFRNRLAKALVSGGRRVMSRVHYPLDSGLQDEQVSQSVMRETTNPLTYALHVLSGE